jgi:hypothetical protein
MHPQHPSPNIRRGQRRFGTRRSKDPAAWIGQGTAWIVHDAARDCYHCYWLVGRPNDHLIERATETSAANAVQWARSRTPKARIRLPDHQTYWAGTEHTPPGFAGTWPTPTRSTIAPAPRFPQTRQRPTLAPTA